MIHEKISKINLMMARRGRKIGGDASLAVCYECKSKIIPHNSISVEFEHHSRYGVMTMGMCVLYVTIDRRLQTFEQLIPDMLSLFPFWRLSI